MPNNQIQVALSKTPNLALLFIAKNGTIAFINKKFEEIFGLSSKAYLGVNFNALIKIDDGLARIYEYLQNSDKDGYQSQKIIIKRGNYYFRAVVSNVLENAKKYSGFIITLVDITHEKELEIKELRQEQLLLQNAKMAVIGEMINSISHQQRQPLSLALLSIGNIEECLESGDLSSASKWISQCKSAINLLNETIDSFRSFYKNDDGQCIFDVVSVINDLTHIIKPTLNTHGISISVNIKDKNLLVNGRKSYLKQALLALVANAKDELINCDLVNANVAIDVLRDSDNIYINISDNGRGINLYKQEIFEPFFTTKESGTGMGLYIAKVLIESKMGGSLELKNNKNPTRFLISLRMR